MHIQDFVFCVFFFKRAKAHCPDSLTKMSFVIGCLISTITFWYLKNNTYYLLVRIQNILIHFMMQTDFLLFSVKAERNYQQETSDLTHNCPWHTLSS